jgi:3-hydroxymyristoyl/3-hydroxydecanoyl-(acyl carrier protein) dehydratase
MFELIQSARFEDKRAHARAHVGADWPPIADHFPGVPLLPGAIQIELCAQIAGPLAERVVKAEHGIDRLAFLVMVRMAAFEHPVRLPATLEIAGRLTRSGATSTTANVEITVGGERVCRVELVMMMLDPDPTWAAASAEAKARVARWERA